MDLLELREDQGGTMTRLDVGPFREWLNDRVVEVGSWDLLAETLGTSARRLHRVRKENKWVDLGFVDECCVLLGCHLSEVYPDA